MTMNLEIMYPIPPLVLTVVLRPGHRAPATDDHPTAGETPTGPAAAPARPAVPEGEPTWEDAAWP